MAASGEEENKSFHDTFDETTLASDPIFKSSKENEPLSNIEDVPKITIDTLDSNDGNGESSTSLSERTSSETVDDPSDTDKYVPPSEDPYERAWKYLSKHDIIHLFQGITSNIFYHKPADPLEDMITQIEKLQEEDRIRKGVIKRTTSNTDPS